jgi:hypothetical protein
MQELTTGTIQMFRALKLGPNVGSPWKYWTGSKPVFLATMTDGEQLVVKGEYNFGNPTADVMANVRFGSRMMKQASPGVHAHNLSGHEVEALKGLRAGQVADVASNRYLDALLKDNGYVWTKLDFVQQLSDVESMIKNGAGLAALGLLKTAAVQTSLGRIAAVDLFLGNEDRFKAAPHAPNLSNIFLRPDGQGQGGYSAIGIDYCFIAMGGSMPKLRSDPEANWNGLLLADQNRGALYAYCADALKRVGDEIEVQLQKSGTTYFPGDLLSTIAPTHFHYGALEGADILKAYLAKKAEFKKVPGIAKRMELLGWKTQ